MANRRSGSPPQSGAVKYLAALLLARDFETQPLFDGLAGLFGEVDYRGPARPFGKTEYYLEEMGPDLTRTIVSFAPLGKAPDLVRVKQAAADLEERFAREGRRRANIDPGYIDYFKLVLASFKDGPQKIDLGTGVYADPVMLFEDGAWRALPWTFPDFRAGTYDEELAAIRRIYRRQRREAAGGGKP